MKKSLLISFMALGAVAWPGTGKTLPSIHSRTLDGQHGIRPCSSNEGSEPGTLDPQAVQSVPEYHIIMDSSKAWLAVT